MATLKVELKEDDIKDACLEYIARKFNMIVLEGVDLHISPGVVDRPGMDTSPSVSASALVESKVSEPVLKDGYCQCDIDKDDRTINEIEANECRACRKAFNCL